MGRREVAEMIRCWGGDEGATLVAARRTATLGRYKLYYYSFLCGFEMISFSDENPGIVEAANAAINNLLHTCQIEKNL
jgi:hypothetical protein